MTDPTPALPADPLALADVAGEKLFHTRGGTKLHIRGCSHFFTTSELVATTPEDAAARQLCEECAAELTGRGRVLYDDLDRALETLPVPVESRARVRELVGQVDADRIWIPYSRSYVALGKDGKRTVYIGKTYVMVGEELTTLPGYAPGGGGGSAGRDRTSAVCPRCGYELPGTGVCGYC